MDANSALPAGWESPHLERDGPWSWRVLRRLRRSSLRRFMAALDDPAQAQAAALARVLDAARGTAFAAEHRLAGVTTLEGYRDAVPVRPASAFEGYLQRVAGGDSLALTRHPVLHLNKTSGTTGAPKLLPVTEPWAAAVADAQAMWVAAMVAEQPEVAKVGGRALTSVGSAIEDRSDAGVPVGANTGRMRGDQPWWVKVRYAVPAEVFAISDAEVRHYVLLRLALAVDVRSWTTANPSTILALCRAAVRHRDDLAGDLVDGTLRRGPAAGLPRATRRRLAPWVWRRRRLPEDPRPAAYWPNLACVNCWKGGAAPFFLERLPAALGREVPVREVGISASEGHIAVPLHSSWWGGVLHAAGHLVELVPVGATEAVGAHLAQAGQDYRVVLSTTAGLYRYDIDDIVRCEGRYRSTPVFRFVRKGDEVLSVTGEKVTSDQVARAAGLALGPGAVGVAVGVHMDEIPALIVVVEGEPPTDAAVGFDRALRELNVEYAGKRSSDRYGPVRLERAPEGTFDRWRAERASLGVADGQLKDRLLVDAATLDRLRAGWG